MRTPRRRKDENPDDDDFTMRWLEALGIPKNEPTPVKGEDVKLSDILKAFDRMLEASDGASILPEREPADGRDLLEKIRQSDLAGEIAFIRGENPCCDLDANDGMILVVANKKGARRIARLMPEKANRAFVTICAFDEHDANYTTLNMEAEGLKKLMNALPGIIAESERMRDIALAIVAEDERD
jgi:hypothetical protein